MDRIDIGTAAQESSLPRWRKPKLTLDTMVAATGADLNAPGDDSQTIYPGIDLGNYS